MSPKLKPLLLPQLVEQRRKHETQVQQGTAEGDQTFVYHSQRSSSSSSDLASPLPETPTFSRSNSRYSGSTSSLEQLTGSSSSCESPASPILGSGQLGSAIVGKSSKSILPDVQEDPLREEEEVTPVAYYNSNTNNYNDNDNGNGNDNDNFSLYDCLCGEPCIHREGESGLGIGANFSYLGCPTDMDYYYDVGFLSDSDFNASERPRKLPTGADSPLGRFGARIPGLSRWKSNSKRSRFTFSPASDPSIDQVAGRSRAASRAASSRSSSISALARHVPDRANEPPLPPTPALSFYESTDSIILAASHDEMDLASAGKSLERERAMATTPLLPPLLTENLSPKEEMASPLQSPTVAMGPMHEDMGYLTPPLSSRPSISSFQPGPVPQMVSAPASMFGSELPSPIPNLIEHDEWSDRLGHANFTITPRPYKPTATSLEALSNLRTDWDSARVSYTRHLCRTGEHYGTTSNTYRLTGAKWAAIDQQWLSIHEELVEAIIRAGNPEADAAELRRGRQQEVQPSAIPKMLDAEGKFPERGDVDIVGPMQRDAVMIRDLSPTDDKRNVSAWLKSLAGKVGIRK